MGGWMGGRVRGWVGAEKRLFNGRISEIVRTYICWQIYESAFLLKWGKLLRRRGCRCCCPWLWGCNGAGERGNSLLVPCLCLRWWWPRRRRGENVRFTPLPLLTPWISEAARLAPGSATPSAPSFAHLTNPRSPKDSLSDSFFLLLLLLLSLLLFLLLLLLLTSSPALRAYVPLLLAPFASVSLPDPLPALSHIGVIFQWEIYATLRCALYTLPPRRLPPRWFIEIFAERYCRRYSRGGGRVGWRRRSVPPLLLRLIRSEAILFWTRYRAVFRSWFRTRESRNFATHHATRTFGYAWRIEILKWAKVNYFHNYGLIWDY